MTFHTLPVPILLIVFNRPQLTQQVFESIRQVKPNKLYIVADGPRQNNIEDYNNCQQVRTIVSQIDWECKVYTNFSETNLGCRKRVESGLNWGFSLEDELIILEDDCIPDPTFFWFCKELLERYRDDKRIMAISGSNFQLGRKSTDFSYYFSRYNHCWGWASWKRAWQYYDSDLKQWTMVRDNNQLQSILETSSAINYWTQIFQRCHDEMIDSWAYRWAFSCWIQNGLTILPNINLVKNIGFNHQATHTQEVDHPLANLTTKAMRFPLIHPPNMIRDSSADRFTQRFVFSPSIVRRIYRRILRTTKKLMS